MKKTLIIEKRKKAKELYAKGWSLRRIAGALVAGKDSVAKWIKMTDEELLIDRRGRKKEK